MSAPLRRFATRLERAYAEQGATAFRRGVPRTECPHQARGYYAFRKICWLAGWDEAARAAEERVA